MNRRRFLVALVLAAAVAAAASLRAQQRGANPNLLRFCPGSGGVAIKCPPILTTAGGLVFTNESGRLVALDAATGKMRWHVNPRGNLSGAPMTCELDGRQFVSTPFGAWALPETR
jgi:hypothetical protein